MMYDVCCMMYDVLLYNRLGKKLSASRSSYDSVVSGSSGWQPPEVACVSLQNNTNGNEHKTANTNGNNRLTKAVDVFSAGCVIYYVLTSRHPFGKK